MTPTIGTFKSAAARTVSPANTPKPLLAIAGKPVMEWTLDLLLPRKEIDRIFIVSNNLFYINYEKWLAEKMEERTGLFHTYGKKIVLCDDKSQNINDKLGAIGDISFVMKQAKIKDDLLVVAGDNLFEINFTDFIRYFKKHGTTVGLKDFKGSSRNIISQYGLVTLDDDKRIIDFEEKPAQPQTTLVAMCLYIFAKGDLKLINEYLKKGFNPDAPGYYLQWLYKQRDIYGYTLKGKWFDIGDIDSYEKASDYYRHKYLGETAKIRRY